MVAPKNDARNIHYKQSFKKSDGPFGKGIYLYDNITDAENNNKNGTTFLLCRALVDKVYEIKGNETLRSINPDAREYNVFIGKYKNCLYYLFTDHRKISDIHYCGGEP